MDNKPDFERFKNLSFDDFKKLALDNSLSIYQKIGFPDSYRKGKELDIFADIFQKIGLADSKNKMLLDIGPGCSDLPLIILDFCTKNNYEVLLADSKEMLDHLPSSNNIHKFEGYFPEGNTTLLNKYKDKVDYIIAYSVFHYVFYTSCIYKFIDTALSLLKPGGKFLIGDIPNITKRRRFFSMETGIQFHKNFTGSDTLPELNDFQSEANHIDDGVIFGILQRYRNFGYETYLLPQNENLPMYNRREDLLICKI